MAERTPFIVIATNPWWGDDPGEADESDPDESTQDESNLDAQDQ